MKEGLDKVSFCLHGRSALTDSHIKKVTRGEGTRGPSTECRDPVSCTDIFDFGACRKNNMRLWTLISCRGRTVALIYELLLDKKAIFFLSMDSDIPPPASSKCLSSKNMGLSLPCLIILKRCGSKYQKCLHLLQCFFLFLLLIIRWETKITSLLRHSQSAYS